MKMFNIQMLPAVFLNCIQCKQVHQSTSSAPPPITSYNQYIETNNFCALSQGKNENNVKLKIFT